MAGSGSIPHDKYAGVSNEALAEAYPAWANRHYPAASNIGEVILAMRRGDEPDFSFEDTRKLEVMERQAAQEAAEDAALQEELAHFEPLRDAHRTPAPQVPRQVVYKGRRPAHVEVITKGDRL